MASFQIIAGDFGQNKEGTVLVGKRYRASGQGLRMPDTDGNFGTYHYGLGQIETLEIATEQILKKMGGSIGWGLAGGLVLGPIGALAGILAGGNRNEVTFVCQFKDGRKFLGRCDTKTYTAIQAASFTPPLVVEKNSREREATAAEKRLGYIIAGVIIALLTLAALLSK